ncbi:sigma-70 family RNA polymerase sigma factor [Rubripirellula sp.]|nr:sigma-70 family RNA polymerase sigma factor [Rubripirellula sp.]MDB4621521.1 sigma-70 family RNA polymerase sigma factor [Rubripirellula sp.]MDC0307259.1 sigma-70 family RNA polymerase sigma factor [bacterium]
MDHSPETRPSLLLRIRDFRDNDAWNQFIELYAPLIYGYLRKRNIQDADAGDLTQDVLSSVTSAANEFTYNPKRGSFRGWLLTVTRNKMLNFVSRKKHLAGSANSGIQRAIEELTAEEDDRTQWDLEYERRIFDWAAEKSRSEFQDSTWQAFWMTAVENHNASSAAEILNISVGAVYVAKSRVMARLREIIDNVVDEGIPS